MRHDIDRVQQAIRDIRKAVRAGERETCDHGDFVLVHGLVPWDPAKNGDWVCLSLSVPAECGLCRVVALSSIMRHHEVIFREVVGHHQPVNWPIDLAGWRSPAYEIRVAPHGPTISKLMPLTCKFDVLCKTEIEFTLICDKIPVDWKKP